MRRDDLRRSYLSPDGVRDLLPVTRAQVLQAALTEECPRCGGTGIDTLTPYRTFDGDCDHCEGRGWLPIEGVALQTILTSAHEERYAFVVPLSTLEGEAHESQD